MKVDTKSALRRRISYLEGNNRQLVQENRALQIELTEISQKLKSLEFNYKLLQKVLEKTENGDY